MAPVAAHYKKGMTQLMENLKKSFLVRGNNIVGFSDKKNFSTAPLGTVLSFAGQARPNGYLLCDGASYKVTDYPDLYAVIGNTYGGDSTNFNVPNLVDASQSPAPTMIYIIKAFHTNEGVDSDAGSGEENKIDSISVNGSPVSIDENKNVDITVPDAYDDTALVQRVSNIESDYANIETLQTDVANINTSLVGKLDKTFTGADVANKILSTDGDGNVVLKDGNEDDTMLKSVYDTDDDGIVDKADSANIAINATDATNAENLKLSDGTIVDAGTINTKLSKLNSDGTLDFSNVGSKPTTLSGYGITDAYTKTEVNNKLDSWHKYNGSIEENTVNTTNTDETITFHSIDTSKAYELWFDTSDGKQATLKLSLISGTDITYTVNTPTVGTKFRLLVKGV